MSNDYYKDIDDMDYDQLAAHCRKHQLDAGIDDASARQVFRLAWDIGHAYGNSEVASYYIDVADVANTVYRNTVKRIADKFTVIDTDL